MEVADSSVIINAALGIDLRSMNACRDVIASSRVAITHTLAESYSMLTRSPAPFGSVPRRRGSCSKTRFPTSRSHSVERGINESCAWFPIGG